MTKQKNPCYPLSSLINSDRVLEHWIFGLLKLKNLKKLLYLQIWYRSQPFFSVCVKICDRKAEILGFCLWTFHVQQKTLFWTETVFKGDSAVWSSSCWPEDWFIFIPELLKLICQSGPLKGLSQGFIYTDCRFQLISKVYSWYFDS